ncbi:MAG: type II secretion system F family protein [Planctomycetota bacterium]|nr:type II secretion system F family protein [Planctomycetota bacterium]
MSRAVRTTESFFVVAMRPDGGRSLGMRRAASDRALYDQLRRERLVPLKTWVLPAWLGQESKLSLKEQLALNQQLGQLLGRGVPLVEALEVVSASVSSKSRPAVERIRDAVSSGTSFADACAQSGMLDAITVAVYRASERTGDLAGAAQQLAVTARRQIAVSGKAATLMIYPAVVMTISIIVSLVMLTMVVPKIGRSLESQRIELPAYSKLTMALGEGIRDNALPLMLAVLVGVFVIVALKKPIGALLGRVMRGTPFFRDVVVAQESTRFFTVMGAMSKSGVPLAESLGVALQALSHPKLRQQITQLRTRLIEGGVLRTMIDSVTALPLPTRRLLIAAERSGDLQTAFESLATDMAEEVDRRSARLLSLLEPLLIVVMFGMIGSLLLSIMIPMMQAASKAL